MYCPECGAHNITGSKFCKNCGKLLQHQNGIKNEVNSQNHTFQSTKASHNSDNFLKKHRLSIALLLVIVLAILGMIIYILYKSSLNSNIKPTKPAPPLTSQQASQMSKQLSSGSESDLRSAVALPSGQSLDPNVAQQMASLGNITFENSTFHDNKDGTATINAHITNPPSGTSSTWVVHLLNVNGQWKIDSTDQAQ